MNVEIQDFSRLSHNLRTPMAAILSSAELLQYFDDSLTRERRNELLDQIKTSIQEILSLLELSRPKPEVARE